MRDKQIATEAIQKLPAGVSLKEISERIKLLAAIREAEEEADANEVISIEQLVRNVESWLSKSS